MVREYQMKKLFKDIRELTKYQWNFMKWQTCHWQWWLVSLTIIVIVSTCSGCSLLKLATAPLMPVQNTLPQELSKSKLKDKCGGQATFNEDGKMVSCSKKYYSYNENFKEQERKLRWNEWLGQLMMRSAGYVVLLVIVFGVLTAMGLGGVVTSFISAIFSVGSRGLKQITKAIQKAKKNNPSLIQELETFTDEDVKKWIVNYKQKNGIK